MPSPVKVFEAKSRVFVFGARASSGFASSPARAVRVLPAFGIQAVSEGARSVTISHQLNQAGLGIIVLPNWETASYWTGSLPDSATFEFTSVAPASASIFWEASIMPFQSVAVGQRSAVINHNKNDIDIPIFVTPNWPTTVHDSTADRTLDTATVYFGSVAFGSSPQIVWRIVE